jgi:hypothetical protein
MIARGSQMTKWVACEVGMAQWKEHKLKKAVVEIVGVDDMAASLTTTRRCLFVSSDRTFPVVDIVESQSKKAEAMTGYQITWQPAHPFTVGALRKLRVEKLKMDPKRLLKIFFVVPREEETYARRPKMAYFDNIAGKQLSADDTEMCDNTSIYVLKPKEDWQKAIETLLYTKGPNNRKQPKAAKQPKTGKQPKQLKMATQPKQQPKTAKQSKGGRGRS